MIPLLLRRKAHIPILLGIAANSIIILTAGKIPALLMSALIQLTVILFVMVLIRSSPNRTDSTRQSYSKQSGGPRANIQQKSMGQTVAVNAQKVQKARGATLREVQGAKKTRRTTPMTTQETSKVIPLTAYRKPDSGLSKTSRRRTHGGITSASTGQQTMQHPYCGDINTDPLMRSGGQTNERAGRSLPNTNFEGDENDDA